LANFLQVSFTARRLASDGFFIPSRVFSTS